MSKAKKIATKILLCFVVTVLIYLHIRYLLWERSYFAVGGEWFIYTIAIIYTICVCTEETL